MLITRWTQQWQSSEHSCCRVVGKQGVFKTKRTTIKDCSFIIVLTIFLAATEIWRFQVQYKKYLLEKYEKDQKAAEV